MTKKINVDETVFEEDGSPIDQKLEKEFLDWEAASDEDFLKFEKETQRI